MPPQPPKRPQQKNTKSSKKLPKTLIFYAESGLGKSTLAAYFPRCGFIIGSQEQGIRYLSGNNLVPDPVWIDEYDTDSPLSFDKVVNRIHKAALDPTIDTLVCETITDFQAMTFAKNCKENFDGNNSENGFFSFQRGPRNAAQFTWPIFIEALNLVAGAGKDVILTAHSKTKEEQDPQGGKFLKYSPYVDQDIWQRAHKWASCVFLIAKKVQLETDKKKTGLKQVAREGGQRLLFLESTPYCVAKNWFGLEGTIDLGDTGKEGYENLRKAFAKVGQ